MPDYRAMEALARMPAHAPERCLFQPHPWTVWGPFISVAQTLSPYVENDPKLLPTKAYRFRVCRRCGCEERQSWTCDIDLIVDPNGIEKRLGRVVA